MRRIAIALGLTFALLAGACGSDDPSATGPADAEGADAGEAGGTDDGAPEDDGDASGDDDGEDGSDEPVRTTVPLAGDDGSSDSEPDSGTDNPDNGDNTDTGDATNDGDAAEPETPDNTAPPTNTTDTGSTTSTAGADATPPAAPPAPNPPPAPDAPPLDTDPAIPAVTAPTIDEVIARGDVLNLAHAGGDQDAPHSTMFAFRQAVAAGADALELDVLLTADGVLVVQHDDTVDKTTETTGPVNQLTLAEIQALDNAYWFSPECWPCQDRPESEYIYRGIRTGEVEPPAGFSADDFRVPTFREVATAFPDFILDVEIKGGDRAVAIAVAEALAREIEELGRTDTVAVASFDDAVIDAFHAAAPDVAVSPGLDRLVSWFLNGATLEPHFKILQVPPFQFGIEVVNAENVARAKAEGFVVWVWPDDASTQENEAFYRTLIGYGVDGVIAGRPAAMTAALS